MCGITGLMAFNEVGRINFIHLEKATRALEKRGPDHQDTYFDQFVGLGHRRLSILDTSDLAHQPMEDASGRYVLAYNGEIYNFKEIRSELAQSGVKFRSDGDTEVLLYALIFWGEKALHKLNGFFAFAFYDKEEQSLMLARDRMGIKPLLYFHDEDKFLFASEMKAMFQYSVTRAINYDAFHIYFQLHYTPAPMTMIEGVYRVMPGEFLVVRKREVIKNQYYEIPRPENKITNLKSASHTLEQLLEESVAMRMISDVPIGTFLSGGIDSSIITALASRHTDQLNTFSVGFKDQPFFDESLYAMAVARKFNTNHHHFSLSTTDMLNNLSVVLETIDDPFADSSAIPVYVLSKETRKHVTVALSGDGADELFGGYNKHAAWIRSLEDNWVSRLVVNLDWVWARLPQSRGGKFGNTIRQLRRYSEGMKLLPEDRYWFWASITSNKKLRELTKVDFTDFSRASSLRDRYLLNLGSGTINEFLYIDLNLVLPNDMLTKVDLMSMANGLEVRVPFLDHRLVAFANQLHSNLKITKSIRKRILQETFRNVLPKALYKRPKKGFEIPLSPWFKKDLGSMLDNVVFNQSYLHEQDIFDPQAVLNLKKQLHSSNPGDAPARIWALLVFQSWYKKYID